MAHQGSHENLYRTNAAEMGSNRSFGFVFTVVFSALGGWQVYQDAQGWGWGLLIAGGAVFGVTLIAPRTLRPLNVLWHRIGLMLHKIVSPLILGMLFFVTVTPTALIFKLLRKDPLNLRLEKSAKTYWIHRHPPGPDPRSMNNQF